jgi:hypothetical protein
MLILRELYYRRIGEEYMLICVTTIMGDVERQAETKHIGDYEDECYNWAKRSLSRRKHEVIEGMYMLLAVEVRVRAQKTKGCGNNNCD